MKKKLSIFLIMLIFALALAACSQSSAPSPSQSEPAADTSAGESQAEGAAAEEPAAASGEEVTLTIATVNNPDMKVMESLTSEFEKAYPGIKLEWVVLPENELRARVTTDVATGAASFDVVTVGAYETPQWGQTDWIESIDALAKANPNSVQPNYDFDDLLPAVKSGLSVNGELYALPFYGESSFTFYNKKMFDEAGLTMPEQPTWDQIREFACQLHKPDEGQYGIVLRGLPGWGEVMAPLTTVVNTYGGRWFDENWMPQLDSPEWNEAVSFYISLVQDCGAPGATGVGFTEALTLMSQSQAAMWVDATVAAGFLASSDAADDISYALAPVGPVPKGNGWLWSWNLAIPTTSEHKAEALQFITWATSKDYIELVASKNGWASVPPGTRKSTYERQEYKDAAPFAGLVLQSMLNADPTDSTRDPVPYTGVQFVAIPEFQGIGTDVSQQIADALAGNITVEEALSNAQALTLQTMEDAGYLDGTAAAAAPAAKELAAEEPAAASGEEATLTIATVNNPDMKVMESLTSEFEKAYPGIKLEWVVLPENELRARVTTDVATGAASFDVVTVGAYETPLWGGTGWIESIDALAKANPDSVQPNYDFEDLLPAVKSGLSANGQLYALPFYGESSFTFYNKAMFDEAGLTMPEQPTWEQIREFACQLHKPDEGQYGIVLRGLPGWGEIMAPLTTVVNTYGGRWFDENWMPQLDSPEWNEAVSFYISLVQDCGAPGATGVGFTEALTLMSQSQAAMWVDATVAAGFLANSDAADDISYALAPVGPVPKGNGWLWSWNLAIPTTSEHKAEALQFITWATSKDYIELVAGKNGWASVPPGTRISTYERQEYKDAAPFAGLVLQSMLNADPTDSTRDPVPYTGVQFVAIPEFQGIGTDVSQYIADALAGNITVEEALQKAQADTLETMQDAGYR